MRIHENVPESYCTEPRRLKQILFNLVGNALKFTFEGSVKIIVKLIINFHGKKYLEIKVVDTGTGIKEENIGLLAIK